MEGTAGLEFPPCALQRHVAFDQLDDIDAAEQFLDEGFGTLDSETLESVTQILESLRQQNRTIGVITHVKSLGERLPTQVIVFKSPQGSRLEVEVL